MGHKRDLLSGRNVLVVEDNFLVAEAIRDLLQEYGSAVLGPVGKVAPALALMDQYRVDAAILDINLQGEWSFPVARRLLARGIPFLFLTGYDDLSIIPPDMREVTRITKPFDDRNLAVHAGLLFSADPAKPLA
jgi:DNA-binding response OmpR family regulator